MEKVSSPLPQLLELVVAVFKRIGDGHHAIILDFIVIEAVIAWVLVACSEPLQNTYFNDTSLLFLCCKVSATMRAVLSLLTRYSAENTRMRLRLLVIERNNSEAPISVMAVFCDKFKLVNLLFLFINEQASAIAPVFPISFPQRLRTLAVTQTHINGALL